MRRGLAPAIAGLLLALLSLAGVYRPATTAAAPAVLQQAGAAQPAAAAVPLPNQEGSLKFAVLGDFGTGSREQYELAAQMSRLHERFPFELVITVGDNLYGGQGPDDFRKKFEEPYKDLLAALTDPGAGGLLLGAVPYAGGVSVADVAVRQADRDRRPGTFERFVEDRPRSTRAWP